MLLLKNVAKRLVLLAYGCLEPNIATLSVIEVDLDFHFEAFHGYKPIACVVKFSFSYNKKKNKAIKSVKCHNFATPKTKW